MHTTLLAAAAATHNIQETACEPLMPPSHFPHPHTHTHTPTPTHPHTHTHTAAPHCDALLIAASVSFRAGRFDEVRRTHPSAAEVTGTSRQSLARSLPRQSGLRTARRTECTRSDRSAQQPACLPRPMPRGLERAHTERWNRRRPCNRHVERAQLRAVWQDDRHLRAAPDGQRCA